MAKPYGLNLKDYDFELPESYIAQLPIEKRDHSKFLVYNRAKNSIEHKYFYDMPSYFGKDDAIILNNSKVTPSRLIGQKKPGNSKIDIVLIKEIEDGKDYIIFSVLTRLSKIKKGNIIKFQNQVSATIIDRLNELVLFKFNLNKKRFYEFLDKYGEAPIPPYIKRPPLTIDRGSYQTVYAKTPGSIAAPTAGLHFTEEIFKTLDKNKASLHYIMLHVGMGTFRPIQNCDITKHIMLPEIYDIDKKTEDMLKNKRKKITSVGTTSTRTIESYCRTQKTFDDTGLYIYPGHDFHIDRLITNFHVPKSTPLMLVTAFLSDGFRKQGLKNPTVLAVKTLKKIYKEAIIKGYRFYSYGDSMMIV